MAASNASCSREGIGQTKRGPLSGDNGKLIIIVPSDLRVLSSRGSARTGRHRARARGFIVCTFRWVAHASRTREWAGVRSDVACWHFADEVDARVYVSFAQQQTYHCGASNGALCQQ